MYPYVYDYGDIVELVRSAGVGTKAGDLMRITDLRGLTAGHSASSSNNYTAVKVDSDGKEVLGFTNFTIYHSDMKPVKDRAIRLRVIERRLKEFRQKVKDMEIEFEMLSKYTSKEDYLAHKIKEAIDSKSGISVIKEILDTKAPDIFGQVE